MSKKRIALIAAGLVAVVYIGIQWNAADIAECNVVAIGAIGDYRKQHGKWPTSASDLRPYGDSYCLDETRPEIKPIDARRAIVIAEDSSWLLGKARSRVVLMMTDDGNVVTDEP